MITITPSLLRACYGALLETAPFTRWKLPSPEEMKFTVVHRKNGLAGYCNYPDAHPDCYGIEINGNYNGSLSAIFPLLAHEIIHMRLHRLGYKTAGHNAMFWRLKKQICKYHCWDERAMP